MKALLQKLERDVDSFYGRTTRWLDELTIVTAENAITSKEWAEFFAMDHGGAKALERAQKIASIVERSLDLEFTADMYANEGAAEKE